MVLLRIYNTLGTVCQVSRIIAPEYMHAHAVQPRPDTPSSLSRCTFTQLAYTEPTATQSFHGRHSKDPVCRHRAQNDSTANVSFTPKADHDCRKRFTLGMSCDRYHPHSFNLRRLYRRQSRALPNTAREGKSTTTSGDRMCEDEFPSTQFPGCHHLFRCWPCQRPS
jgi:hypothetical protein